MKYVNARHIAIATLAGMSLWSHAAMATIAPGINDPVTGTPWIKASTLEEGLAQGFRLATPQEFSDYLGHGGFGVPSATQEFFTRTASRSLMGFASDTYVPPAMPGQYGGPSVAFGRLAGGVDQLGAIMATSGSQLDFCPGSNAYNCYKTIYVNEAAFGELSAMAAGQHDRYAYGSGGDWAGALKNLKQADGSYKLGYFMISSVPEPRSWMLMGLGLLAISAAGRARLKANLKPTWA
jgi:PEP-CTERM motif